MRRQLDSLDSDRNIFEDIVGRLTSLEEKIKHSRNHDEETTKDIKQEINTAMQRVEDKVEEVQDSLDEKKVVHVKKLSWTGVTLILANPILSFIPVALVVGQVILIIGCILKGGDKL